ncbi:thiamine pyrophosphate-binding protein [Variovorax sp. J22R115]|uniref:thiamine pyrophosphate-binding protein n=1 Tax=Variovorax sp. J22R115 TaxID=3053509 RepID=UPI0025771E49|nr:thiamine pyrophosphate-binding protein [Variovorax sp. J22R115]MDM0053586.1 thiamine pyrophosphate-binding protein [Variovorax sp. J22R115]
MTEKMTGARCFARLLKAYGVSHVFFMDAVLRRALAEMEDVGITRILGHSEKGVGYMADGYARIAGRPGICMAQSVGAANLAASLQDPYLGHSSVIAFSGRHVAAMQYRNAYQEVVHGGLYAPVTKFHAQMEVIEQMPHLIRQAFRETTTATPRPVHVDVAGLTGDALTPFEAEFDLRADAAHAAVPAFRPGADGAAVARAATAIARSQRPVIVADRGVVISGAGGALRALAERIQAPIVTTLDAKTMVVDQDPLSRGMVGLYGRSCANHTVDEADLVIFAGSNTNDHTTGNWKLPRPDKAVIQIDLDPVEIGRNYPDCIGLQCDVRAGLEALAVAASPARHDDWLAHTQRFVDDWRAAAQAELESDAFPMRPQRLCRELTRVLPANAILVADTGYAALWTGNYVFLRHPAQTYLRAAGSLGWSFPASIGAKAAAPDRPVVCFTGDGGFSYHLPELETARRCGLKTITVVNNNHCLSQGVRNLDIAYQGRPEGRKSDCYVYRETDFARIAESFDCLGITVERPEDFSAAFDRAMASELPVVIDVKTEFAYQATLPWVPA